MVRNMLNKLSLIVTSSDWQGCNVVSNLGHLEQAFGQIIKHGPTSLEFVSFTFQSTNNCHLSFSITKNCVSHWLMNLNLVFSRLAWRETLLKKAQANIDVWSVDGPTSRGLWVDSLLTKVISELVNRFLLKKKNLKDRSCAVLCGLCKFRIYEYPKWQKQDWIQSNW